MIHQIIAGGAGATLTLEQVLAVVQGAEVVLDAAAAQRLKKESPAPKAFQAEPAPASPAASTCSALDRSQARAALFFKLLALINGRSGVRLAVAEALAGLLNRGATPVLPAAAADREALASLAAFLQGVGSATGPDGAQLSAADALTAGGGEAPGLSAAERAVISDGQAASAGTAALCAQAGKLLLSVANAVAALSAEALQADVSSECSHRGFRLPAASMLGSRLPLPVRPLPAALPGCAQHPPTANRAPRIAAGQGPGRGGAGGAAAQGCAGGGR